MNQWAGAYKSYGFYVVLDADDGYDALKDHMTSNSLLDLHGYCRGGAAMRWTGIFKYSSSTGYPQNIWIDRDGYIRAYHSGGVDYDPPGTWEALLDQLNGAI